MNYLIDGYNLIFQCGLNGRSRNPQSIEKARDRLLSVLSQHLSDLQRQSTTVVFDAKRLPLKETAARSTQQGIAVLFSIGYPDADTLIEELIARDSTPKQLTVVSSDHRIQTAALRRRAIAIDSDRWMDWLEIQSASTTKSTEPEVGKKQILEELSSVDWTAEFGEIDLQPLLPEDSEGEVETSSPDLKPGLTESDLDQASLDDLEQTFQEMDWDWADGEIDLDP